jgi:outer membrane porin, OprD family
MCRKTVVLFFLLSIFYSSSSQQVVENSKDEDTTSLLYAFKKGKTEGHFRLFYMATDNDGPLTDYYALAFGGGLKYQTKSFKGFQLGVGGFYTWNVASSDLTKPDPLTNAISRYEIGQFDQANPSNKNNLERLEDFYIRYNFKSSFIKFGKQVIKTPFINPQDGRMRPTGEQGVWLEINDLKKIKIEAGWLSHFSPRGTVEWYRGANSIGIYSTGVNINGTASNYKNNLDSKGIAVAGIKYSPNSSIHFQLWDHWVENIFNTVLLQADVDFSIEENKKIIGGFQHIHQSALNDGGNADMSKTYFDPSQKVNIYGARIGYSNKKGSVKLNYSHFTSQGRFLFPREWGREPLYTFMARERNEGLGDVDAITLNIGATFFAGRLNADFSAGYYDLPDVKNYRLNKYGFPSYSQFNFDLRYSFGGFLKGLNAELLYLYKRNNGNTYNNWKYIINKTNMHQLNFIFNYIF